MSRKQWTALGVTLGMLGLAALLLVQFSASQRLGPSGLRLTSEPTYIPGGQVVRTQSVHLPDALPGYTIKLVETNMPLNLLTGVPPTVISELESTWLPQDTLFARRVYASTNGFEAQLGVVLMGADRTSIHKPQFCLDAQGWRIEKSEVAVIPMTRPYPYDLKVMKLTAGKQALDDQGRPVKATALYVYWFVADKLLTPHHGERMWWMAQELIRTGVLQRWAYVSYFTYWVGSTPSLEEAAFARVKELVAASVPEFQLTAGAPRPVSGRAALASPPAGEGRVAQGAPLNR